jgi:hypothetical protein
LRKLKAKLQIRHTEELHSMSLVFSLLQKDYIVFAADSRHTRGDGSGSFYKNDQGLKTLEIKRGHALFGFAGRDWGENIAGLAKSKGLLDADGTLEATADAFCKFTVGEYEKHYGSCEPGFKPTVEFMLTGWVESYDGEQIATTYTFRLPDQASHSPWQYPYRRFQTIGKSCHGALYSLHRFGNQDLPIDAALRLAAFTLREISEQDTSVGGDLLLYTLRPRGQVIKQTAKEVSALALVAETAGKKLESLLLGRD